MPWLLLGTAILALLILGLRAFERASAAAIFNLLKWIAAFAGVALTGLLLLSGRGPQALTGLVLVGPLLWRRNRRDRRNCVRWFGGNTAAAKAKFDDDPRGGV